LCCANGRSRRAGWSGWTQTSKSPRPANKVYGSMLRFMLLQSGDCVAVRLSLQGLKQVVGDAGRGDDCAEVTGSWPRITKRAATRLSPWVELVTREVEFSPGAEPQIYHSVATFDYVIILAVTPDGRIPLVRQYRPAVEDFTLELPGGIVDTSEDPAVTASRELLEETGLASETLHLLGTNKADAGRLSNRVHSYFIRTRPQVSDFQPEEGITIQFVTTAELVEMIGTGAFDAQANLGTVLLAVLCGCLTLPAPSDRRAPGKSNNESQ
jgi:ADP-ribose pyrophosphatase